MAGYRMKKKYNFLNYPLDYQRIIKAYKAKEVVSKRWHNLFFTFYSPAIFSFAYDAFF